MSALELLSLFADSAKEAIRFLGNDFAVHNQVDLDPFHDKATGRISIKSSDGTRLNTYIVTVELEKRE